MKKMLIIIGILAVLLVGCEKTDIAQTYKKSENDGIYYTYYKMKDGTWKCDDKTYQYRLELTGRLPNAVTDSCYVVLTDNENLTFEDVSNSLLGSLLEDSRAMHGSVLVEWK